MKWLYVTRDFVFPTVWEIETQCNGTAIQLSNLDQIRKVLATTAWMIKLYRLLMSGNGVGLSKMYGGHTLDQVIDSPV